MNDYFFSTCSKKKDNIQTKKVLCDELSMQHKINTLLFGNHFALQFSSMCQIRILVNEMAKIRILITEMARHLLIKSWITIFLIKYTALELNEVIQKHQT